MKQFFVFACFVFALTSCQDDDDMSAFTCISDQVGDTILLPDGSEGLTIDAIYQDNRCPCLTPCLVAGGVGIRLLSPTSDTLLIGVGDSTAPDSTLTYNGFNLRLRSVTHREVCDYLELTQSDYCAEFIWE
ncbi:hypothetical protein FUA23_07950 [Neolewinella aurantiaca]|uniref:Lipoprotein n=1 Tax=Neolewinella aurantiaca TaxID=2602767 RepID=A0A5C7FG23_9BACT|nr:lipoprotein [Neolewinella aurantiaca]TXF90159.1 hypothetical protein FUA23_07950 [Neolewinella aurantiaca]